MTTEEIRSRITETITPNGLGAITASAHQALLLELVDYIGSTAECRGARELYEACGAVYNESTGYYELNGLTDITEAQMAAIYVATKDFPERASACTGEQIRTNINRRADDYKGAGSVDMINYFAYCAALEVANVAKDTPLSFSDVRRMFFNCASLKTIIGGIDMSAQEDNISTGMFSGCEALEDVTLLYLNGSVSLADSPNISKASLITMIENYYNTSIIRLHADAYTRLTMDDDIAAYLNDPSYDVTIVSA